MQRWDMLHSHHDIAVAVSVQLGEHALVALHVVASHWREAGGVWLLLICLRLRLLHGLRLRLFVEAQPKSEIGLVKCMVHIDFLSLEVNVVQQAMAGN